MAPASSTPVGPPPTMTKVRNAWRLSEFDSRSASSQPRMMRRRRPSASATASKRGPRGRWSAAGAAHSGFEDTLGPTMGRYFVGLELGGSGTRAALVDADGNLLATGQGVSSGHLSGAAGRRHLARALDGTLASIA